ncbi:hypothetical protein RIF23_10405 [Lipingzhangella sp. LS1_29]|uniref:Uncharacterized protein n=1 Tax=Lipingzhangella rawalii TaxID=2055835 RepID=A0ABU2H7D4_9ACTN|nr:hypothetical protein [Lipingzhangella rawalii]MDS1270710.1 hypothetical protein [Lipingzhangella rawalii]
MRYLFPSTGRWVRLVQPASVAATRALAENGLHLSNYCRRLDPAEAVINAGVQTAGGVLPLGFDSADRPVRPWMGCAVELCHDHGGQLPTGPRYTGGASDEGEHSAADTWRSTFRRMPYQCDVLAARSMMVETFETACTWDRLTQLRAAVTSAKAALHPVTPGLFADDGR